MYRNTTQLQLDPTQATAPSESLRFAVYRNTTQLQLDPTQATAPSESLVPQGASIALILMAAGSSSRFAQSSPKTHAIKKQWLRIGEKPLWLFVADTLSAMYPFVQIRITASEQEASYMQKLCSYEIVIGGETRQESLRNALQGIESEWVLVSDVARAGIVAVARKIISALIVTSLDSSDNAQTQSKQRAASLEKVDSRGNVDCHAAAHAAARNDREIATSEKVDSRDNAQNLNNYMQKLCSYEIVIGGETRQESLRNALQGIESEWVLVSDVARAGIVAVARKIISALIVTSLDSSDNAQTQSKQRAASLEKVDSRGNVDCHAAAHAAARNDREIATSEKVDSRDNAQNLNNPQAEGLSKETSLRSFCGNTTGAESVFDNHAAGGRIFLKKHRFARFDEKAEILKVDSRDNAQNLNNSQAAGLCGNNTEAQNVFCSQLIGGRIFDEKAGLCSGEQGDKTWASIDAASHKLPAFSKVDSRDNAQNLNNSQAAGLCGNNTEAQNVFCSQLIGGRIFDEKAGLCSGEQGDKTWASIDAASHKLPAFSQKANAQNTQVDCVAPILAVPDTAIYDESYIDRSKLFRVQTPQLSRVSALRAALESTQDQGTDESSIIKANGGIVRYIQGDRALEKLTLASDMAALEQILGQAQSWQHAAPFAPMPTLRVGNGLDVHSFEAGKVMKLGGVVIESEFGFKAHSDGDVALHSVIDAILGAMGAGDIGEWFPDSSSAWEGADSARLLEIVWGFARSVGYELCNLDLTIIAQKPRLGAYKQPIRARIAEILGVPLSAINVKATTTEQLGFVGRAEGVCAMSSVSLRIVSFAEVAQSYQLYKG